MVRLEASPEGLVLLDVCLHDVFFARHLVEDGEEKVPFCSVVLLDAPVP